MPRSSHKKTRNRLVNTLPHKTHLYENKQYFDLVIFLFFRRLGMGLVVGFHQMLKAYLRVALGGSQSAVPQQLLHTAQVCPCRKQVRGKRMAQAVRRHCKIQPGPAAQELHNARGLPAVQARTARTHKESLLVRQGQERPLVKPCLEALARCVGKRRKPLARAFAHNAQHAR